MGNDIYTWFTVNWRQFGLGVHVFIGTRTWEAYIDLGPISAGIGR
jgi:hypothetical protein